MARRIRWQIFIATISSLLVFGLMSYLALTSAAAALPLEGGDYVEGIAARPLHLNPLVSDTSRDSAAADIQALVFNGLMSIGVNGIPKTALAQSFEINDAATVYTFTLRTNVFWHDGTPVTIDDVLFTLKAVQNRSFSGDRSASDIWRNVLIDRVDDQRVRCTLSAPFAPFLSRATFPILPKHILGTLPPDEWGKVPFDRQPIGTGPYRLIELTTDHALLHANPQYYEGHPFINSIELRFFDSPQATLAALTRNEIMGFGFLSPNDLVQGPLPRGMVRYRAPLDSYTTLTFNMREGPLMDQGLRRALAKGFDKDALITQTLNGQVVRIDTPLLSGWSTEMKQHRWYPYDQASAAEDLTRLGYLTGPDGVRVKDGEVLVLSLLTDAAPDHVATANEIARQWGALGVKVVVEQIDTTELQQRLTDHRFSMAIQGWRRLGADPDVFELWHSSQASRDNNYAGLRDDRIDTLLAQARGNRTLPERASDYAEFEQRWVELVPSIMLYQPLFIYTTTEHLRGLNFAAFDDTGTQLSFTNILIGREDRFRHIEDWFLRSAREIRGNLRRVS